MPVTRTLAALAACSALLAIGAAGWAAFHGLWMPGLFHLLSGLAVSWLLLRLRPLAYRGVERKDLVGHRVGLAIFPLALGALVLSPAFAADTGSDRSLPLFLFGVATLGLCVVPGVLPATCYPNRTSDVGQAAPDQPSSGRS